MNTHTHSSRIKKSPGYRPFFYRPRVISTGIAPIIPEDHPNTIAALAHEIRNPLTNINLAAEMLKSTIIDTELIVFVDIIRRNSARINHLIIELLQNHAPDKEEAGRHSMHLLLDDVLEMAGDRIRLKNIIVIKEYVLQDKQIQMDKDRMSIALTNIVINAIDAMPSDTGELRLTEVVIDGHYSLQIADNGCGISADHLPQIFRPYFTRKPGGLGFGLSVTRDILQSNRVRINVESKEGEGTRFILLFGQEHVRLFA